MSSVQLLAEVPTFIETLLSALLSGALLLYMDLLDSLSYLIRNMMVIFLSKKLTKDLRFEYNYGIGKIEAISSLFGDAIVLFGLLLTFCLSIYSLFYPSRPSDLLIAVAGFKLYDILWDSAFFIKQRKIHKEHPSSATKTNYAAAFGTLLFDGFAFLALLAMWLLRDNPIGGYISPSVSIIIAVYLTIGCFKRIRAALDELADKTLPEEKQLKILSVLNRHYNNYSQFHSINSHKVGESVRLDLHLSFEKGTSADEVVDLKDQLRDEFDSEIGDCVVNIVLERD